MSKTKAEWQTLYNEARTALWEIGRAEKDKAHEGLLGKCYRVTNSYGVDEDWWLYSKIIGVADGSLVMFRFETTSRGEIRIEPDQDRPELGEGYEQISRADFDFAWQQLLARINSLPTSVL